MFDLKRRRIRSTDISMDKIYGKNLSTFTDVIMNRREERCSRLQPS